jgi:hypothetical protein
MHPAGGRSRRHRSTEHALGGLLRDFAKSAEDLGGLLDLSPDIVDGLRDMAIFLPG